MRRIALLVAVFALAGCGGHGTRSPEQVVRAWSAALNRNDNAAAAQLFATPARIIQNGETELPTRAAVARWNSGLPCGGEITSLELRGTTQVLAVFTLKSRPSHRCDAVGGQAAALFQVERGRIVLWHQTEVPSDLQRGQTV